MNDVEYKVSLYPSKENLARWNINKDKGDITIFISNIWNHIIDRHKDFYFFVEYYICILLMERICLERAFNKIKIKGGRCNPCCVKNVAIEMYDAL